MIALSLSLIAVVAGMFLLARARQENLGTFYKIVAYFVIVCALIVFGFGFAGTICRHRCMSGGCSPSEQCMMTGKTCGEEMGMGKCAKGKGKMDCCAAKAGVADSNEIGTGHPEHGSEGHSH
jgi:hypothetical protein